MKHLGSQEGLHHRGTGKKVSAGVPKGSGHHLEVSPGGCQKRQGLPRGGKQQEGMLGLLQDMGNLAAVEGKEKPVEGVVG